MAANTLVMQTQNNRGVLRFTDVSDLIAVLGTIDRGHVAKLRQEARSIAQPVEAAIKSGIPIAPPLSGFTPAVVPGRLTWGTGVAYNATKIETPYLKKKARYNSIVRVKTLSPATGLADMAGRSRRSIAKYPYTREYPYSLSPTGTRKHRITANGSRKFIDNLNGAPGVKQSHASRYIWPSAERALPSAQMKMVAALQKYYDEVNVRLRS